MLLSLAIGEDVIDQENRFKKRRFVKIEKKEVDGKIYICIRCKIKTTFY